MKSIRILLLLSFFCSLSASAQQTHAAPPEAPDAQGGWIDIDPPSGFSGSFSYPEDTKDRYRFRIRDTVGLAGNWQLHLIPQDTEASYYYWIGVIKPDGSMFGGEIYGQYNIACGEPREVVNIVLPESEDDGWYTGIEVYRNFEACGDLERSTSSSFVLEWELLGSPVEPPTPTPSPEPFSDKSCELWMNASPDSLRAGESAYVGLQAAWGDGSPIANRDVYFGILEGSGDLSTLQSKTDATGWVEIEYYAPLQINQATIVLVGALVDGCEDVDMGSVQLTLISDSGEQPPTAIPTPTATPTSTPPSAADLETETSLTLQHEISPVNTVYLGVSADGATDLAIEATIQGPADSYVMWEAVDIDTGDYLNDFLRIETQETHFSRVLFRPPQTFRRPFDAVMTASVDTPNGTISESTTVHVVRPPVILVHGLWSDEQSMWPLFYVLSQSVQFSDIRIYNYGGTSIQGVQANTYGLANTIYQSRKKLQDELIKCERVDLVAHSMGGLIARYYMTVGYQDNTGKTIGPQADRVRKLITLATPHAGSHVANWYCELENDCPDNDYAKAEIQNCPPYDPEHVTRSEVDWFLGWVRNREGMRSDALSYGQAVRELQTAYRPQSIQDVLPQTLPTNGQQYYFLAGSQPFLTAFYERWFADNVALWDYPFNLDQPGDCGQMAQSPGVQRMVSEFVNHAKRPETDGVVPLNSALGGTLPADGRIIIPANHFSITRNGNAWFATTMLLTNFQVVPSQGLWLATSSPGHVHIYDQDDNHVGLDSNGEPEVTISGAIYKPFQDTQGEHEFVFVPSTEALRVEFNAHMEGTAGLDISQILQDGMHYLQFSDVVVLPGSQIQVDLNPDNPQGTLQNPGDSPQALTPTAQRLGGVPQDLLPEGITLEPVWQDQASGQITVTDSEWLLFGGICSSLFFFGGTAALLVLGHKQRKLYWLLILLIPILLCSCAGTVWTLLKGLL
jgi:pimeloyl-ACP methyl ester carboxylesterase